MLDTGWVERHAPAVLPPEKTRSPLCRRLGGPHDGQADIATLTKMIAARNNTALNIFIKAATVNSKQIH
jgi:hypothetical protein